MYLGSSAEPSPAWKMANLVSADPASRAVPAAAAAVRLRRPASPAVSTPVTVRTWALRRSLPPMDFTIPWAVVPVPGFLVAFWLAERYRARFSGRPGWLGHLGTFLDSIHLIRELFVRPGRWWPALAGMALFWATDAFACWAGLGAFGYQMDAAALFVGFATGRVFTRRTGPLAGAGVLALVLPLTIMTWKARTVRCSPTS